MAREKNHGQDLGGGGDMDKIDGIDEIGNTLDESKCKLRFLEDVFAQKKDSTEFGDEANFGLSVILCDLADDLDRGSQIFSDLMKAEARENLCEVSLKKMMARPERQPGGEEKETIATRPSNEWTVKETMEIFAEIRKMYEQTRLEYGALAVLKKIGYAESSPALTMFEIISTGFCELGIGFKGRLWDRFGVPFVGRDKKYEARCAAFWASEWPLLDTDQQKEARTAFQNLSKDLQSSFNAWLEQIRAKMGISRLGNKGRKMKRSPAGIERPLMRPKKDLKEKGV